MNESEYVKNFKKKLEEGQLKYIKRERRTTHAVLTDFREGFVIAEIEDTESGAKTYLLAYTQKGLVVTSMVFTSEIDALNAIDFAKTLLSGLAKPNNNRPTLQEVINKYSDTFAHFDDGDKCATSEQNGVSQSEMHK